MNKKFIYLFLFFFIVLFASCEKQNSNGGGTTPPGEEQPPNGGGKEPQNFIYPNEDWSVAIPEKYGFKANLGEIIENYIASTPQLTTTGLMVIVGGEVIHSYGNLTELSYLASCRKSILAMMMGRFVENGTIDLSLTLEEMGMDDVGGLLPIEKEATILDCITARSGVYHPASNSGDDTDSAPPRGSKTPGEYFLYNNWDFNIAGTIFENLTGSNIYQALYTELALPLEFQDFSLDAQRKGGTLSISQYPAYHIYLSTRDMARIGYVMLRKGKWKERQIISKEWVEQITSAYTSVDEMNPRGKYPLWGYGYMWWVWDGNANREGYLGAYTAIGAGGQFITVLPALDMVVVQKTSTNDNNADKYWTLLGRIINAKIN
ncbi:MAG: serine hydrolase [Bacteroidales bacterium]